ncbi:MAG: hypothetical protein AAF702_19685 [Chloroflexota bacterium]
MRTALRVVLVVGLILHPVIGVDAQDTSPPEPIQEDIKSVVPSASTAATSSLVEVSSAPNETTTATIANTSNVHLWPPYEQLSPLPAYGQAMYYNPGIMELVLENRLKAGQVAPCRDCAGYVAMLRVGDLDRKIWIQLPDGTVEGPFQVIDAADKKHIPMLITKGWIVDIDYETAMRWRMAGPKSVTLWAEPPLNYHTISNRIASGGEYQVDIYRHEKLDYFNQAHEYAGYVETLYIQ